MRKDSVIDKRAGRLVYWARMIHANMPESILSNMKEPFRNCAEAVEKLLYDRYGDEEYQIVSHSSGTELFYVKVEYDTIDEKDENGKPIHVVNEYDEEFWSEKEACDFADKRSESDWKDVNSDTFHIEVCSWDPYGYFTVCSKDERNVLDGARYRTERAALGAFIRKFNMPEYHRYIYSISSEPTKRLLRAIYGEQIEVTQNGDNNSAVVNNGTININM